jgi:hypothetical protein
VALLSLLSTQHPVAIDELVHQLNISRDHVVIIPAAEAISQMGGTVAFLALPDLDEEGAE